MNKQGILLNGIEKHKKYLLAVSGGMDSMAMADLFLKAFRDKQCGQIEVAHCNFNLRGSESDEDEGLVKHWCLVNNIEFNGASFQTSAYANENKVSIQVAARDLRYAFFYQVVSLKKLDIICTAHHLDDNIETLLFHFFRGTGIKGLTGIPEKSEQIIRPLLSVSKADLANYCKQNQIVFREDSSNAKSNYTRNNIRNVIMPFLASHFGNLQTNLAQNLVRFNEANIIYNQAIQTIQKKLIEKRGQDIYIPILKLKKNEPLSTIVYELLRPFHFNFEQAQEVIKLMNRSSGSLVENDHYRVIKNRDFLIITTHKTENTDMILIDSIHEEMQVIQTKDFELHVRKLFQRPAIIPSSSELLFMDADNLVFPLVMRKWRLGDYMYPLGMMKKKKVARILIDAKMALHEKEKIWVLESEKKIIWLIGQKLDNRFRIKESTKSIIAFQYKNR